MASEFSPIFAAMFAQGAHGAINQRRKYTNDPYFTHCKNVAFTVAAIKGLRPEVMAAAYLHDVVEDTQVTLELIEQVFGKDIAQLVSEVTDVSKPDDGNRAVRKATDREHLSKSSMEGATIKLADLIDNTSSITKYDPNFAKIYMQEKRELLKVLQHGNSGLLDRASRLVEQYFTV